MALLSSPSARVQENAARALGNLSANAANKVKIASAGGIPRLTALLASPSAGVRDAAAGALRSIGAAKVID